MLAAFALPAQAQESAIPRVRYSAASSLSIPFDISPANDPHLKAILFAQDPATKGWSIGRSVPASRRSFDLTNLPDGTYNLAVRAVYGNDDKAVGQLPVPTAPELVVVVDSKPPVLALTMAQIAWEDSYLECMISDANPDQESVKVSAKVFDSDRFYQINASKISFRQEGTVWRYLLGVETTDQTEFVRVELTDRAGNVGKEELRIRESPPEISQPQPVVHAEFTSDPQSDFLANQTPLFTEQSVFPEHDQRQSGESIAFLNTELGQPPKFESAWQSLPLDSEKSPSDARPASAERPQAHSRSTNSVNHAVFAPQEVLPPQVMSWSSEVPAVPEKKTPVAKATLIPVPAPAGVRMLPPESTNSNPPIPVGDNDPLPPSGAESSDLTPFPVIPPNTVQDTVSEYDIMLRAARNSVSLEETAEALDRFRACLRLAPDRPEARREYAHLLAAQQPYAAVPILEAVLSDNPSDKTTAAILSELLIDAKRYDRALVILRQATALMPGQVELDALMIRLLVALGQQKEASEYFDVHMSSLVFGDEIHRTEVMRSLSELGRDQESLTLAEAAMLERPGDLTTASDLIRIRCRLRRLDGLESLIRSLDLSGPADHLAAVNLARELTNGGHYQAAHKLLEAVQVHDRTHPDALLALAELLLAEGFAESAESVLQQGQFADNDIRFLMLQSRLHLLRGELSQARVFLSTVPGSGNDLDRILLDGSVLEAATAFDLAEQCYQNALSHFPDEPGLLCALAGLYERTSHYSQAMGLCETVLQADPQNRQAWLIWSQASVKSGQIDEAIMRVTGALEIVLEGGEDARFLHNLSAYLAWHNGNHSAAFVDFGLGKIDQQMPAESPEFAFAWYQCLIRNGQTTRADQFLSSCLTTPAYGVRMVKIAEDQLQFPTAKLIILQLAERFSDNQLVMEQFADLMAKTGSGTAVANYEKFLNQRPQNVSARLGLAHVMWSEQQLERAIQLLDSILEEVPEHRTAARDRARILNQWKGKDAAMRGYKDAELGLKHPLTGNIHASLLDDQAFVRSSIEFQSLSTETLFGNKLEQQATYLADWRPDNASAALRRLQDLTPLDSHVAFLLAQQNIQMGRFAEAEVALEELLTNDPWHSQASQALAYTRRQLEHRVGGHFSLFSQRGRNGLSQVSRTRFGARYFKPIGSQNDVFSIGYSHIMLNPPDARHSLGNALDLGYHWVPDPNLEVNLQMSVEAYEVGYDTKPVFQIASRYRPLDGLYFGLNLQLQNVVENSESISQGIYQYGIGPTVEWDVSPRWNLFAEYNIQHYSDDNLVQLFDVRNVYLFRTAPRELRGVLNYHLEDFSEQTIRNPVLSDLTGTIHPYFAPEQFGYVNAGLEWQHWLTPMILGEYEFSYTVRYALQWDSLNVAYNTFGVSFDWDITTNARLTVSTDHVLSGPYDSSTFMAAFTLHLPSGRAFLREDRLRRHPGSMTGTSQ